jgi:hypothetical protein
MAGRHSLAPSPAVPPVPEVSDRPDTLAVGAAFIVFIGVLIVAAGIPQPDARMELPGSHIAGVYVPSYVFPGAGFATSDLVFPGALLVLGALCGVLALALNRPLLSIGAGLPGFVLFTVGVWQAMRAGSDERYLSGEIGMGTIMLLAGSILMIAGAVLAFEPRRIGGRRAR